MKGSEPVDSRNLFDFRFVDRYQQKKDIAKFLNSELTFNTLWLSGKQGIGKTRLLKEIVEKQASKDRDYIFCSFEETNSTDKLEEFIDLLQRKSKLKFFDFLKVHYESIFDISKKITTGILKIAGFDLGDFVDAAYDSTKIFITHKTQQHSAIKVIANYLNIILANKRLIVVLDHFSKCKQETVDLFMQIIAQFVDNKNIHFIISTTEEEMEYRNDISSKILLKIPVHTMILSEFDEDIYFYEILQDIFHIPDESKPIISQIHTICDGSPVKLQAALMESYRSNIIYLEKEKAVIDFLKLRQIILQKEFGFKLENYKLPAQIIFRLIIALDEQAPSLLLIKASKFIVDNMFLGLGVLKEDLSSELSNLYQYNVIEFSLDGNSIVKINNPIIREILREKFKYDPTNKLFSKTLVDFLCENKEFVLSLGLTSDWIEKMIVSHAINGKTNNWIQLALEYGIFKYRKNRFSDAAEYFETILSQTEYISSENLFPIVDCFFQVGKYTTAETLLRELEKRSDCNKWTYNYYFSRTENLLLRKEHALQLAEEATHNAHSREEKIKALNMQQQILVDMTDGKERAKIIFDNLVELFKKSDTETKSQILPTLKTAVDFYHAEETFAFLDLAKKMALQENNQIEEAFILTNEGFEHFRQGNIESAENCFLNSAKKLFDIRTHEISYPLNNLANCYMSKNMFEEALTILLKSSLWNTSSYVFVTNETLLMVCYAHIGKTEKAIEMINKLLAYIEQFDINDKTMLRKIYLNIALVYKKINKPYLSEEFAKKAYPLSFNTSSWYRAYTLIKNLYEDEPNPISFCREKEKWYWSNGDYEPWLVTFSHD